MAATNSSVPKNNWSTKKRGSFLGKEIRRLTGLSFPTAMHIGKCMARGGLWGYFSRLAEKQEVIVCIDLVGDERVWERKVELKGGGFIVAQLRRVRDEEFCDIIIEGPKGKF